MKSAAALQHDLWRIFSKWVRIRDCIKTCESIYFGRCYTCGKTVDFNASEAGHFVSRGCDALCYNEQNVHLQCHHCNNFLKGNEPAYKLALDEEYGEGTWRWLKSRKFEFKQYRAPELLELIEHYTKEFNSLKNTYG